MINTETILYGIIGTPVKHSLSPHLHNALFKKYNVNGVYLAFETNDTHGAINAVKTLNIKGMSVTIPNKISILDFVDNIDDSVKIIGASNTIINNNGIITAYNTDVYGVTETFKKNSVDCNDKKIMLIGSGGAARAVISGLLSSYKIKSLKILGIKKDEINTLLSFIKKHSDIWTEGLIINDTIIKTIAEQSDIIINSSPIGMHPDIENSPLPSEYIKLEHILFDVIYNPEKTKLLIEAENKGCKICSGIDMFIFQAYKQFELFTGIKPDYEYIKNLAKKNRDGSYNK